MPKQKPPTPQELYRARRRSQEAYLPPGLINQGNTCFMNSVLQGLIATPLLADLAQFHNIPDQVQKYSNTPLVSRRSPQLTNGHGRGGANEKLPVAMPIGDRFIEILYHAWDIQSQRSRGNLNPKELLSALGQIYDQYLDFAQQDAHEFLRILLDAIRMEELDVIKQRQPPLLKQPRKRRRSSRANLSSPTMPSKQSQPSQSLSEPDTLLSLPDMIFGGKLTSILVCQKCKNISQTYEDFNDLSLSLKAEDYAVLHSRTRDRFKKLAKRLAALPSTSLIAAANTSTSSSRAIGNGKERSRAERDDDIATTQDNGRMNVGLQIQRSSSVPPSPREREDPQISEKLLPHLIKPRRSMEYLRPDMMLPLSGDSSSSASGSDSHLDRLREPNGTNDSLSSVQEEHSTAAGEKETESDGSNIIVNRPALPRSTSSVDKHVDFVPAHNPPNAKNKKKKEFEDSLVKFGRRISLRVGIGHKKDKDQGTEKGKEKHQKRSKSADRPTSSSSVAPPAVANSQEVGDKGKENVKEKRNKSVDRRSNASSLGVASSADIDPPSSTSTKEVPSIPDANSTLSSSPGTAASIKISISSCDAVIARSDVSDDPASPPLPVIAEPQPLRSFSPQHPNLSRRGSPLHSMHTHIQSQVHRVSGSVRRSKSPKPPKQSEEEKEYLRRLLADVGPATIRVSREGETARDGGGGGGGRHFHKKTHLQPPEDHGSKAGNGNVGSWLALAAVSQFSGLEECLRMFTAVEVLDGENMVGCRRCWKIQNGLIKGDQDGGDSDNEEEEAREEEVREYREERERESTVLTVISESSTSSVADYVSTPASSVEDDDTSEKGEFGSPQLAVSSPKEPLASSTRSMNPFAAYISATSQPHLSKYSNPGDEATLVTPRMSPPSRKHQPLPPTPDDHRAVQSDTSQSLPSTPGGLPIPLIATTPAADFPTSSTGGSADNHHNDSTHNAASSDVESNSNVMLEVGAEEEGATEDEAKKKRRGMVFRDSLVVPVGKSGRSGRVKRRESPDEWLSSEAESLGTDMSVDGSTTGGSVTTGSVTTGSEGSESRRESLEEDVRGDVAHTLPLGLGHLQKKNTSHTNTIPVLHQVSAILKRGSESKRVEKSISVAKSTSIAKSTSKPKKKKETILRPAFKRYLISDPPPVLVIHLKRFQQLGDSSSHHTSGFASFAERFAANFTNPQTNAQYMARNNYGAGFGGFGGLGSGGFKKLEDFVSFPEWLDLTPFLAPKKERIVSVKRSSGGGGGGADVGVGKEDERCMYRLYSVVVHIGNMLGGHYVSYVALPNQPSSYEVKGKANGEAPSPSSLPSPSDSAGSTPTNEKQTFAAGLKSGKRQWAYISDTSVRLTSLEEVLRARAYLCMYERV